MARRDETVVTDLEYQSESNPSPPEPSKVTHSSTDVNWLVGFCSFLLLWIILAIHAYCAGRAEEMDESGKNSRRVIDPESVWSPQMNIYSLAVERFGPSYSCPWHIVVGYIMLSGTIAFLYMVMLWWLTIFIVHSAMFAFLALLLTATIVLFIEDVKEGMRIWSYTWHFLFIFIAALLIFLAYRKEIPLACEVIKETSKIITWFPALAIVPVVRLFLEAIVVSFSAMAFIFIFRIPTSSSNQAFFFRLIFYSLVNFFASLWLLFFIDGFIRMVLYGTYSRWYWTRYKSRIPKNTVISVVKTTIRYHLGTIALESLVMTLSRFIQALQPLSKKIPWILWIAPRFFARLYLAFCAIRLGFEVLIEFVRIANFNAYVVCASHGTNFARSAKFAHYLTTKMGSINILVVDRVKLAILCLGHLLAIGTSVGATYITCRKNEDLEKSMIHMITMVGVGSFVLTRAILCILSTAIDTLIFCAVEDFGKNGGSGDKPYFMNFKLRILFVESRKRSLMKLPV